MTASGSPNKSSKAPDDLLSVQKLVKFSLARGFAFRVGVWGYGRVLVIALLTVSTQALRAATTNPVDALRYE